jgi:hypothetical protein
MNVITFMNVSAHASTCFFSRTYRQVLEKKQVLA